MCSWQALRCELWQSHLAGITWLCPSQAVMSVTVCQRQADNKQSCNLMTTTEKTAGGHTLVLVNKTQILTKRSASAELRKIHSGLAVECCRKTLRPSSHTDQLFPMFVLFTSISASYSLSFSFWTLIRFFLYNTKRNEILNIESVQQTQNHP